MTDEASEPAPQESADLIEASVGQARRDSALFMNRIRFALSSAFVVLYVFSILVLDMESMRETVWLAVAYATGSGLLWHFAKCSRNVLKISRFAVPLFDIPVVTLIQWINLPIAISAQATTMFTLSIFLFLTVMSSFSMRARHLFACALAGTFGMWLLEWRGGVPVISFFSAPLMLFAAAWMMSYLPGRQISLIREAAERKARRDRLARHFSPGVAELIEAHDEPGEGEACELSVLFCDIRGFTEISESMKPREVVGLLNEFHGYMVDAIFRFGGTLDKYLGDGLLAYFNAPTRQKDHAERAVLCALAMIEDLKTFNQKWAQDGVAPIRVGIGVHSGQAIVGEIGAAHRREFTAIGDTVNVGSRLQGLTKNYESDVLVSEPVVRQIAESVGLKFDNVGSVAVRGRRQEVEVFVPLGK